VLCQCPTDLNSPAGGKIPGKFAGKTGRTGGGTTTHDSLLNHLMCFTHGDGIMPRKWGMNSRADDGRGFARVSAATGHDATPQGRKMVLKNRFWGAEGHVRFASKFALVFLA